MTTQPMQILVEPLAQIGLDVDAIVHVTIRDRSGKELERTEHEFKSGEILLVGKRHPCVECSQKRDRLDMLEEKLRNIADEAVVDRRGR